jgi:hypothetical protein
MAAAVLLSLIGSACGVLGILLVSGRALSLLGGAVEQWVFLASWQCAIAGSLFKLSRTRVSLRIRDGNATAANEGPVPAVGVEIHRPSCRQASTSFFSAASPAPPISRFPTHWSGRMEAR